MGMNMGRRLIRGKHRIIAYNRSRERTRQIAKEGAQSAGPKYGEQ
jgi:6-phosphogluconate dehydrogenase (decarboxylating)